MKNLIQYSFVSLMAIALSGCYINLSAPLPNMAVPLKAETWQKTGEAYCTGFLWVFGNGDCSMEAALENGGITKVHHVDTDIKVVLFGAYVETALKVHGE